MLRRLLSAASVELLGEEVDGLGDGGFGRVGLPKRVEHDEVVDDALVAGRGDGDAGGAEVVGVGLALVAQHVGLTGDDECGRQAGELLGGCLER